MNPTATFTWKSKTISILSLDDILRLRRQAQEKEPKKEIAVPEIDEYHCNYCHINDYKHDQFSLSRLNELDCPYCLNTGYAVWKPLFTTYVQIGRYVNEQFFDEKPASLNDHHISILYQILGMVRREDTPWRNHMIVQEYDPDMPFFNDLLTEGLVNVRDNPGGSGYMFSATTAGRTLALQYLTSAHKHSKSNVVNISMQETKEKRNTL